MDIPLALQIKDIHHQDFNMVIGMVLDPMAHLDLDHHHRALTHKDPNRDHHPECHSKDHHLVRDPLEVRLLAAYLQILEVLHRDQTGTDLLDQACHTTILAQASHPTISHRLCRAPHLARDPSLEAHHLDRWEEVPLKAHQHLM